MGVKGLIGDIYKYFSTCRICGAKIPTEYRYYNACPLCPDCLKK